MNYLEKSLVNDTVLTGGLLAAAIAWLVLAATSIAPAGPTDTTAPEAAVARIAAPTDASLSLPVVRADKVS